MKTYNAYGIVICRKNDLFENVRYIMDTSSTAKTVRFIVQFAKYKCYIIHYMIVLMDWIVTMVYTNFTDKVW